MTGLSRRAALGGVLGGALGVAAAGVAAQAGAVEGGAQPCLRPNARGGWDLAPPPAAQLLRPAWEGTTAPCLVPGGDLAKAFAAYDQAKAERESVPGGVPDSVFLPVLYREIDALVEVTAAPCATVSEAGYKLHRLTVDQAMRDQLEHAQDRVAFLASLAAGFGISGGFGPSSVDVDD